MKTSTCDKTPIIIQAVISLLVPGILFLSGVAPLRAAESSNTVYQTKIIRAESPIVIDGILDEPDWAKAAPIGEIVQREPRPGEPATEKTEVKLLYDHQNFYIGVMCYDSAADRVIGTQMERDADLSFDDHIEILIDTFRDRRNAFYFATNPAGALVDGLIIENGQINREWDAIWSVRTRRFDQGWSAEFAIPFKSLSFHKGQSVWGFNFSRTIKRKLEEDRWASPRLDVRFLQVSEAGEISGFSEVRQGLGLDVRPYGSSKWFHHNATRDGALTGKGGADIFYNITPSLKWTTTVNTDFAETEVDGRQINLTRFPLFFPEKRSFFLENAGVFNFSNLSGPSPDLLPFFSRRLGLLGGREVPILAGTKLTGKAGRYDIGIVDVRTRAVESLDGRNFFVGRVKRNLFAQSYVGALFTEGEPASALTQRTFGADLRLATARFLGRERNFGIDVFALKSHDEKVRGQDGAYGLSASYPNDLWDIRMDWRQIEKNFNPALGFAPRTNVRKLFAAVEFNPRPKNFMNVRQMFHEFRYTRFTRMDNQQVESWRFFMAPINYTLNSGDRIEFNYVPTFERLFEPFAIAKGVVLQKGDYRFTRWRAEFGTAEKRPWEIEGTWWFGTYWSGHAHQVTTSFLYRWKSRFRGSLDLDQTFARLKQGDFVTRIISWRSNYSVSPFLTFYNLLQFDSESKNLGWQSRVRWIIHPGNELFFVFTHGHLQDDRGGFHFRPAETGLALKLHYTFRF
ncbi:MAG: carbohydrate binding family 9 domain-containing protein [Acidobacteria bacterium]|nr:carbohydrate binding family 9 domain-containing protein [Acidobacteriota bacterium]MBI3655160.1 carbohydrate binding family 9 domain-containing protein [Acidobacteriota bacterium]